MNLDCPTQAKLVWVEDEDRGASFINARASGSLGMTKRAIAKWNV